MLGGSAPVTLAGRIVQANAEALSGLVLHQLKANGAPIISGFALPPLDMRTSCVVYAAPELRLANSAFSDLYQYYDIPRWSSAGSDAHVFDAQASMEHVFGTLMASLDGANLIHDVAYLGQGLLGNPALIVMCAEIISYIEQLMAGFDLGTEALGLDTIHAVGPGGNYLMEEHTLRNFRKVQWRPQFLNRDNPQAWVEKGGKRYEERVIEKTLEILTNYVPEPLPEAVQTKLTALEREAEAVLEALDFAA
jgi:trimethylamine--corrinoid protein Co-methyltransferase